MNTTTTRRDFLQKSLLGLSGTAFLGACNSKTSSTANAATGDLETTSALLGFIALTDAAPLFVADEKGFFKKHGMTDVQVLKQSSWGTTRDNLALGSARNGIDGAHVLTPIPYLMSLGTVTANNQPVPISILARLNTSGQCISVANEYKDLNIGTDASPLKERFAAKRAAGTAVNCANTFPGGTHDMWIRYWLAAGGIDPDRDVTMITVPPAQMVANMKVNSMEAFCVCEPWNLQLINQNIGYTANITGELWNNHPEKSFCLRSDYVEKHPKATQALLMAIMEAQMFCEDPANAKEVAEICSRRRWINAPFDDIFDRIAGKFDYGTGRVVENSPYKMRYWSENASFPYRSHEQWFLVENQRWGMLPTDLDTTAILNQVNRADLWREAATTLGVAASDIPASDSRGIETFFDGKTFDPENPKAYLESLTIKRI